MNTAFLFASALSAITWAIHTFLGGRECARPLLRSDLHPVPKLTNYYCWHIVTLTLCVMSAGFAYAALVPAGGDVGLMCGALALAFLVWNVVLVAWKRQPPLHFPQWALFGPIAIAAAFGVLQWHA